MTTRYATHAVLRLVGFDEPTVPALPSADWPGAPAFAAIAPDASTCAAAPGGVAFVGAAAAGAREWMSIAVFDDGAAARRAYDAGRAAPAWASGAREHWCGLLEPVSHRGTVNWLDRAAPGPLFEPCEPRRHDGPLVVITSVGWIAGPGLDTARVLDFVGRSREVRTGMRGRPGLRAANGFVVEPAIVGPDALTVTFWSDARAMADFAYRPGRHADEMAHSAVVGNYDRGSFTRLRALERHGTWGGADPLAPARRAASGTLLDTESP